MGRYTVSRENFTPTAGSDALTLISGTGRRIRLIEVRFSGRGTTSAAQQVTVSRSTAGTTPGGAIVPSKADHSEQLASNFTTATTWAAQPTPETNGIVCGFNALGGAHAFPAPRGAVLEARSGECISLRAAAGVTFQAMSLSCVVEED